MSAEDGTGPQGQVGGRDEVEGLSPVAERLAALRDDNRRLRELLAAAGRLAEFGRFAAKMNHELRQPLFAIKGLAQLLLDRSHVDVEEVRDFARHIVEQSERLTMLVADLRHLSIPVSRSSRQVTDVSPVLLRVASLLDWRFRKGVTLRTELGPDLPLLAVAGHELEQMLVNLLANALDAVAGRPSPIIQIRVQREPVGTTAGGARGAGGRGGGGGGADGGSESGGMVAIFVADNGSGVPLSARARLFEDFFTTKGAEAGTGLGLAVSREIARAAGGALELLEAVGTWSDPVTTVFKLTLPIAAEEFAGLSP